MIQSPISIWEAQWILTTIWPSIKEKFFYSFFDTVKANRDRIEVALEELEKEANVLMGNILQDLLIGQPQLPSGSVDFLKSMATTEWSEKQGKALLETPIIWQLTQIHIVQDPEFKKISSRVDRAMTSFMKIYRKEALKYESWHVNSKLLHKERENLVSMLDLCLKDMQSFLVKKSIKGIEWLILQSIKSPNPQKIDIENIQQQFLDIENKNYYSDVVLSIDKFLEKMIWFITIE